MDNKTRFHPYVTTLDLTYQACGGPAPCADCGKYETDIVHRYHDFIRRGLPCRSGTFSPPQFDGLDKLLFEFDSSRYPVAVYCYHNVDRIYIKVTRQEINIFEVGQGSTIQKYNASIRGKLTLTGIDDIENLRPFNVEIHAYDPISNKKYKLSILDICTTEWIKIIDTNTRFDVCYVARAYIPWQALDINICLIEKESEK